jgi:predicted RNA-binding Zn ribbon-like protein
MASQLVEDLRLPRTVAAHPALELCNTLAGWQDDEPNEYLQSYAHLAVWARLAGLIGLPESVRLRELAADSPARAAAVLRRAKAFRAGWYELVTSDRPSERSVAVVEREVRRAGAVLRLDPGARGAALGPAADALDAPVLLAAHAAWRMVDRGQLVHVGRCPGECCGWVFYDPEGRRRWCIMEICGNRDKVRRFRERRRQAGLAGSA